MGLELSVAFLGLCALALDPRCALLNERGNRPKPGRDDTGTENGTFSGPGRLPFVCLCICVLVCMRVF